MVTIRPPPGHPLRHAKPPPKIWPPRLTNAQFEVLISNIKDWQIAHGSLLKLVYTDEESTVLSRPVGASIFPTLFPQELFDRALALQKIYNKLYAAVADDEDWLHEILKDLIAVDPLTSALWRVHEETKRIGSVQNLNLGIFRSDYMLHVDESTSNEGPVLKQVEFNTVSCAGGVHGDKIADMHNHLHRMGAYETIKQHKHEGISRINFLQPKTKTLENICLGLQEAHSAYSPGYFPAQYRNVCVLIVVQPNNFNIGDERPIEYGLWDIGVPTFRIEWGSDILNHTRLTENRELIYHPPTRDRPMEVGVVYYRAGFESEEYEAADIDGIKIRLKLESSKAIKCPSVLSHLTTLKKVQQALAVPGTLERYLEPSEAALIKETFVPMYPLDESNEGEKGKSLASSLEDAQNHVLKPSLEGGGHNIYGENIPAFLEEMPPDRWHIHILQEKIKPPISRNYLVSHQDLYDGPAISELGVFGICLWQTDANKETSRQEVSMQVNLEPSYVLKTKDASVDELSVVKGYGCFSSVMLVDMDTFLSCLKTPE